MSEERALYITTGPDPPELKPCPFCGGDVGLKWNEISGEYEFLCNGCGSLTLFHNDLTDTEATNHWNSRT